MKKNGLIINGKKVEKISGDFHVKNIMYFLTNILKLYSVKNKIEKEEDDDGIPIRCLDFSKQQINLDKIIVKHFV
jgi:hypothetical protein